MPPNYFLIDSTSFGAAVVLDKKIGEILNYISHLPEAGDDPESVRYHLDQLEFIPLIEFWIYNPYFKKVLRSYFGDFDELYIKYIRYRAPPHKRGAQKFHRDWYRDSQAKRMEVFIALDHSLKRNGATEIINSNNKRVIPEVSKGGVLAIDSSAIHRGRDNQTGESRQIISFQIGKRLFAVEDYVSKISFL